MARQAAVPTHPTTRRDLAMWLRRTRAHYNQFDRLTATQLRYRAQELEYLYGCAALGVKPLQQVIDETRSGQRDREIARVRQNIMLNVVRRAGWRREGYWFDSERRLQAPLRVAAPTPRSASAVATRPREHRAGGAVRHRGPPEDPDPEPSESALNAIWTSALDLFTSVDEFQTLGEYCRIRAIWLEAVAA